MLTEDTAAEHRHSISVQVAKLVLTPSVRHPMVPLVSMSEQSQ